MFQLLLCIPIWFWILESIKYSYNDADSCHQGPADRFIKERKYAITKFLQCAHSVFWAKQYGQKKHLVIILTAITVTIWLMISRNDIFLHCNFHFYWKILHHSLGSVPNKHIFLHLKSDLWDRASLLLHDTSLKRCFVTCLMWICEYSFSQFQYCT